MTKKNKKATSGAPTPDAPKKLEMLERFLIYIYDKDLLGPEGNIKILTMQQELQYYILANQTYIFKSTELEGLLQNNGYLLNIKKGNEYIISMEKIRSLVEAQPSASEFGDVDDKVLKYVSTIQRNLGSEYLSAKKSCFICYTTYKTRANLSDHLRKRHGHNFDINLDAKQVVIPQIFDMTHTEETVRQEISFKLTNASEQNYRIQNIYLYNGMWLVNLPFSTDSTEKIADTYCNKMFFNKSLFKYSVLIQALGEAEGNQHEIIEQHQLWVKTSLFKNIRKSGKVQIHFDRLDNYWPRKENKNLTRNEHLNYNIMTHENYIEVLQCFAEMEDWSTLHQFRQYDHYQLQMQNTEKPELYEFDLKKLRRIPNRIEENSLAKIVLVDMNKHNHQSNNDVPNDKQMNDNEVSAFSHELTKDKMVLKIIKNGENMSAAKKYAIRFLPNRQTVKIQQRILDVANKLELSPLMFPSQDLQVKQLKDNFTTFKWFNPNIEGNAEQQQAVCQIINGTAYPAPYILFGPPGTGKTMTLVETIAQIWKLKPQSNVLVTAQANSVCDEIAERLLRYIPPQDILRYYSEASEKRMDDTNQLVYQISNLYVDNTESVKYLEIFKSYRIVLATLTRSGWINLAKIDPKHFDYVIIDECGSATETSSLIPIVGAAAIKRKILANVVLAGDPKQLGPVINSKEAENDGFGLSLLERLLSNKLYKRNYNGNTYNPKYITRLVQNYRSHPSILKISNEMFYGGELQCLGKKDVTEYALDWKFLPNPKFPIIFHSVIGVTETESDHSSFNLDEVKLVLEYIEKLFQFGINKKSVKQTDIGVVTPYRKQCLTLRSKFNERKWNDIEVGSVEQYQGREKKVMILTTVRSRTEHVGFLNNPKRFNVALTRAQALLIVIGNARTLKMDQYWQRLINYCVKNHGFIGYRP